MSAPTANGRPLSPQMVADVIAELVGMRDAALRSRELAANRMRNSMDLRRHKQVRAHEYRAFALRVAIESLGGAIPEAPFEQLERVCRENSMPERRVA